MRCETQNTENKDMTTYMHTSPHAHIEIKDNSGLFGSFLFFVTVDDTLENQEDDMQRQRFFASAYSMHSSSKQLHVRTDIDYDSDIIAAAHIAHEDDYAAIEPVLLAVAERFDVDEDRALDLISELEQLDAGDFDAENSWWLQLQTAKAAKLLGYRGVEVGDEQGSAVIIDCAGWVSDAIHVF
jgi:hypothetical protein